MENYHPEFQLSKITKDNSYRFNPVSFSCLAANDPNQPVPQFEPLNREHRHSFDLLEMESNNLLEMTGGHY
jgi:hypothetical protein